MIHRKFIYVHFVPGVQQRETLPERCLQHVSEHWAGWDERPDLRDWAGNALPGGWFMLKSGFYVCTCAWEDEDE